MKQNTVFSSANIILPCVKDQEKWAVIACDQFTSDADYWKKCAEYIGQSPSTFDFILPEAYLGTEKEREKKESIRRAMEAIDSYPLSTVDGFIAVERTLPDKKVRRGLVGKIDLEYYDYKPNSTSLIRATEKTVLSRIPPRVKIRSEATVEIPHVLIFTKPGCSFIKKAIELTKGKKAAYDFQLMMGGGHLKGYSLSGEEKESVEDAILDYEKSDEEVLYAVGDGNHSLAAAKSFYEDLKAKLGTSATSHPARYALCELVDIDDSSILFEPIYRILTECDPHDVIKKLSDICSKTGDQIITAVTADKTETMSFKNPGNSLTVGILQEFIDNYISQNPSVRCDYIHGEKELISFAHKENCIGFLFDGVDKEDLFDYVSVHGTYPRKTFSMGEAKSKRYYYEMRKIIL